MHLKKCTLFLSFCTAFAPKRQGSPPFERKRRDGEREILLSHLCGFPAARGRTSSSVISHRQSRTHFSFAARLFTLGQGGVFSPEISHRQSRTHLSFATGLFTLGQGGVFFPSFHIDSHARRFLLQCDFSRLGKGACFFRAFTSTVTDAFFFCNETIHDRAREEHLRVKPHTGADTRFFRCGSFVGRREERRRFHSPIGAKKIPISPAKRRQPLDNRLLFCYTV